MMTIKATLTVDAAPQPADPVVDAHVKSLRPPRPEPDKRQLQAETDMLCRIVDRLAAMGHGTSIAAQLLEVKHSTLLTKLKHAQQGELVSLGAAAASAGQLIDYLCSLPETPEEGLALLQRALDAYGKDGIGTLKSLAEYLGVSYALLFRWRTEPPKRVKIEHLMALHKLTARGVI